MIDADQRSGPGLRAGDVVENGAHRAIATFRSSRCTAKAKRDGYEQVEDATPTRTRTGRRVGVGQLLAVAELSSGPRSAPATEVFLTRAIRMLISGGITVRRACGRMIRRSTWLNFMPMLRAASAWPAGTLLTPERTASQMKAEV